MQNLKFAFSSIMAHKMRSLLTMIGIIIGVSSVVVIHGSQDAFFAYYDWDYYRCFISCCDYGFG
ncbi:TPA: hypothetical protein VY284_001639 [Streptococcus pneumoniae]|nr:hypothetical protein [Streptococcus pneumoniae]HEV5084176.1 hypothetical protein [Streptococcus pneumoniae]